MLPPAIPLAIGFSLLSHAEAFTIPSSPQQVLGISTADKESCPLAPKVLLNDTDLFPSLRYLQDEAILQRQVTRLSKAVQIPTQITDTMTDPDNDAFAPFVDFHKLLAELFPLVYSKANIEHVNRFNLIITLDTSPDTTKTRKPLLFTAHQDVVPINDASDWTHPPFSGYFDGEFLWGRGSSDCKNGLIGLLSAVEDLLSQGWVPSRPVVLAFGFDEEAQGYIGAARIAPVLEERYGKDGIEFILDEGGGGLSTLHSSSGEDENVIYALPDVGEKGAVTIVLSLSVPGGHSSIPPKHTGVGIMSEIIYKLENTELDIFTPKLGSQHPSRQVFECQVRHSPQYVEDWLSSALDSNDQAAAAEAIAESRGQSVRHTLQSSQAADVFNGGIKSNALPEKITAVVNYRVALHQTPEMLQERAERIIRPIIEKFNLTLSGFSDTDEDEANVFMGSSGHFALSTLNGPLNPAPVSPTDIQTSPVWARFAGVTRSVFESVPSLKGKTVVVGGDITTGNTDTRLYWNLSQNIYRWSPAREGRSLNIHTVDERIGIDAHLEAMMLYYDLIRAFDLWDSSE
ncbi:Gly-Xaa carboxypeptidase [Aspergillus undulatus]|uniref:Gly-Xaa carboxypeptidase n=1 Tax=Aspergillus undulatus TaxID=1810928 RepID=UPI003CCD13B4